MSTCMRQIRTERAGLAHHLPQPRASVPHKVPGPTRQRSARLSEAGLTVGQCEHRNQLHAAALSVQIVGRVRCSALIGAYQARVLLI
eukprot:746334-Rhodomonas_salina.1